MQNSITWVGMDVHAENNVLAAVRGSSEAIVFRAEFPNTPKGRGLMSLFPCFLTPFYPPPSFLCQ
jgi:hypothetical protein